jgi:hypothetical protein
MPADLVKEALDIESMGKTSDLNPSNVVAEALWSELRSPAESNPELVALIIAVRSCPSRNLAALTLRAPSYTRTPLSRPLFQIPRTSSRTGCFICR